MRYLYGATEDKFVKQNGPTSSKDLKPLRTYRFSVHSFLQGKQKFDKNALPIIFKVSPDSLLNLAIKQIDNMPLPSVYTWSNVHVCTWLRNYGYAQYQNTFRQNLVNGRTLLLLDAAALSAMNIKNFDDMRHIAYGIRMLFYYEMTKFTRSISLAPEYHHELYKLFRVKSGNRFALSRRTDLWRQLQLIRQQSPNLSHWELLERWLTLQPHAEQPELFGAVRRHKLYKCKKQPPPAPHLQHISASNCVCVPPCDCGSSELHMRTPWRLSCLSPRAELSPLKKPCSCIPPCNCHWSFNKYASPSVLTCLHNVLPHKYGAQYSSVSESQSTRKPKRYSLHF